MKRPNAIRGSVATPTNRVGLTSSGPIVQIAPTRFTVQGSSPKPYEIDLLNIPRGR